MEKHHIWEKGYNWNSVTCGLENGKYLGSIIDNPVMVCDKNVEEIKTIPATFHEKIINVETKNFCVLLAFLLIPLHYW